jgi:hypothetical protein
LWKAQAEQEAFESIGKTSTSSSEPEISDKWVSLGYERKSNLAKELEEEGYELGWVAANNEAERVEFENWDYVLVELPNHAKARLKIHDHPAIGGYLVLLKRRKR